MPDYTDAYLILVIGGSVAGVCYFLACHRAALALSVGVALSPFAGNWHELGIPNGLAPDRFCLGLGIVLAMNQRRSSLRPTDQPAGLLWLMGIACVYVLLSGIAFDSFLSKSAFFHFIDAFGVIPFVLFAVSPVAFERPRDRDFLVGALVILGVYLGLTTLFETLKFDVLVWPKYILNPLYGDAAGAGRARGPFAAAVQNGFGLYICTVGCLMALLRWRQVKVRAVAGAASVLCLVGVLLTLQRSVWVGATVGTVALIVSKGPMRKISASVAAMGIVGMALALLFIPSLSSNFAQRRADSETVWERKNLATAAVNMIEARPLTGFGWGRFAVASGPYFRQAPGFPLVGTTTVEHNVYLSYGAELGLPGLLLWLLSSMCALMWIVSRKISGTEFAIWRQGTIAVGSAYFVIIYFIPPPTGLPAISVWLFAGVAGALRGHKEVGPTVLDPGFSTP